MSSTARKRKEEVAQALKKLIQSKGKTPAMKYQQLFDDLRTQSEAVSVSQISFPFANRMTVMLHQLDESLILTYTLTVMYYFLF